MPTNQDIIVGIDLGTTFSLVAYVDERGAHVIRDENGDARLPSVIGVTPDANGTPHVAVGWEARNRAIENARTTVYSIKRLLGRSPAEVMQELGFLAYAVVPGPRETVRVEIDGRLYSPEEISSIILRSLKERAERHLGMSVTRAIITVPAYFDDSQRQATRQAGQAAGLDVVRIINEPTSAALAYGIGLRQHASQGETSSAAPTPLAGGARSQPTPARVALPIPKCASAASTLAQNGADCRDSAPRSTNQAQTVAVFDFGGGTFDVSILRIEDDVFQVLATAGDTHLGGDDFDRTIVELVSREIHEQFGLEVRTPTTRQALRTLAESVKTRLSDEMEAKIELDLGTGRVYRRTLTRADFEALAAPLVERTLKLCDAALRDAKLASADLDEVILVGGSTRMPIVRKRVTAHFGKPPYTALNPDEVVALGAAVQGSILAGARMEMLLLDVTPLSLGIETMGGAMGKLIIRNTTIPCRATEMFTTFVDGQTAIKINVLQGERELAADCRSLGEFELRGIPPLPAGMPKVELEFLIDANGILNVAARELRSGKEAAIQVIPNSGLTSGEVDRMMRDSIAFAAADVQAHRRIDLCNQVDFDTAKTEQMIAKYGALLAPAERERIEREMTSLRALATRTRRQQGGNLDELHAALEAFDRGTVNLAEIGIREALTQPTNPD